MTGSGVIKNVALMTPTYRGDLERFELLCESIDRFVSGYERHYVIVNDDDLPFFARFETSRRTVLPSSPFLPPWLRALPPFVSRKGRRTWWSFRSGPLHGWHIQQLLKISGILQLPHQRFCIVDSDNVFFRPFDVAAYAGADTIPLYVDRRPSCRGAAACGLGPERRSPAGRRPHVLPRRRLYRQRSGMGQIDRARHDRDDRGRDAERRGRWRSARRARSPNTSSMGILSASRRPTGPRHRLTTQSLATSHWEHDTLDEAGADRHGREVAV